MGALALYGLDRSEHEVLRWYEGYCRKLDVIDNAPADYLARLVETERAHEHDIKIAYSAMSQTKHFKDRAYAEAASRYLDR